MWNEKFDVRNKPKTGTLVPYLLVALHKIDGSAHGKEVKEKAIDLLDASQELLDFLNGGKKNYLEAEYGWAMTRLREDGFGKKAGESGLKRGYWELTDKGKELARQLANTYDINFVNKVRGESNMNRKAREKDYHEGRGKKS